LKILSKLLLGECKTIVTARKRVTDTFFGRGRRVSQRENENTTDWARPVKFTVCREVTWQERPKILSKFRTFFPNNTSTTVPRAISIYADFFIGKSIFIGGHTMPKIQLKPDRLFDPGRPKKFLTKHTKAQRRSEL